jgi:hypothetical protein
MKTILSLAFFIVFSGNLLFAQISVILIPWNATCNGACNGGIHAEATGGTPPYTFNWNGYPPYPDLIGLCAGTYTCIVTDANSLMGYNQVTVMEPSPLISNTSSTNDNGTGNGTATVIVSGGTQSYYYLWDDPSAQTTQTATGLTSGWYHVTVTDANSCTKTDSVEVHLWSGVETQKINFSYSLSPNPVLSDFDLRISTNKAENISVIVYNSLGEIIINKEILLVSGDNLQNFNVQQIVSGIYFIEIKGINNTSYLKFIKT